MRNIKRFNPMPFNVKKMLRLSALAVTLSVLAGCGDSTEPGQELLTCNVPQIPNAGGSACIDPPPLSCPTGTFPDASNESCVSGRDPNAPDPVVFAGENQAVLFYNRPQDDAYDGYRLHTWNNEACDAYAASSVASAWSNGLIHDGVDPNYGAYWILDLKPGYAGTASRAGNLG